MKPLRPLTADEHDDESFHRQLISKKRQPGRKILEALLPELFHRFDVYREYVRKLEIIPATPENVRAEGDRIKVMFDYKKPLVNVVAALQARCRHMCPMCGEPIAPMTIDHFLPKAEFPEFSVFSLNLIPCCWSCNVQKGDTYLDLNNERLIINPYSDAFISAAFLHCTILPRFDAPLFRLTVDENKIGAANANLCRRHIAHLRLGPRFQVYCERRYFSFWRNLYDEYGRTEFTVRSVKSLAAKGMIDAVAAFGPNSWEAAIMAAIQRNVMLTRFFLTSVPPASLDRLGAAVLSR